MIYDSIIWKREMRKKTEKFRGLINKTEFSAEWLFDEEPDGWTASYKLFVKFQKYCFYCAVITRKFIESNRLSDELLAINYPVKYFKRANSKVLTKQNFESVDEEYETENPLLGEMSLLKICHLFIHSFVFIPKLLEVKIDEQLPDEELENWEVNGISGLYINSDFTKDKIVYYLDLDFIFRLFEDVHNDNVVYYVEDLATGKVVRSRNKPTDSDGAAK
jgi:hypothetical protein